MKFGKRILTLLITLTMVTSIFTLPSVASNGTYSYVIITSNAIVENSLELDHFINMKEFQGHTVKVVTEDEFGVKTGQFPNDKADKIRKWLQDNYVGLGIEYVLLIGDPDPDDKKFSGDHVGDVPMKMCWPRYFRLGDGAPTDLYFSDLDSEWDWDGDGFYHEAKEYNAPTSPHPSIDPDTFSVKWRGEVMIDYDEEYTFEILSDDGVQFWIDGVLLINNWPEHELKYNEWTGTMDSGKHNISLNFRENYGDGIIKLFWKTTDSSYVEREIIPADHLYDSGGVVNGLSGQYFNNNNFTDMTLSRKDPEINFEWGTGDMAPSDPDYGPEVYVGRIPVYDAKYEDLDKILRKIIDYETDDPTAIGWRESILLPMVRMSPTTTSAGLGEEIKNVISDPNGFYTYRIYEGGTGFSPELTPVTIDNVKNEWKNGYGMVTWHTHGGETGASYVMDTDNIGVLDDSKPAFIMQASCHNARPENPNNLAYSLLKHGAIATIAGTRMTTYQMGDYLPGSFLPSKYMNHQMAYFYTKHIIDSGMPAGKAYAQVVDDHSNPNSNAIEFNLYGDPDCYLLTTFLNEFPVADANGDYSGYEGSPITFDAIDSYDPEGAALDYRWDFDNNGEWDTDWSTSSTAQFTWGDDHSGTVKVEVRDDIGKTAIDTASVTVENVAPTTSLDTLNQPNQQFILPLIHDLTFEGSFTDPGWLDTHTSEWDFGDTTIIPGTMTEENDEPDSTGTSTAGHTYSAPGIYTITLNVTDDDGDNDTDTMQIEVVDEFGALQDINDYIQNLSNSSFKNNPEERKNALYNKISSIFKMLEKKKYNSATNSLLNDIREKADGHIDGKIGDDWIIDPVAQMHICMKIDDLTAYLALL